MKNMEELKKYKIRKLGDSDVIINPAEEKKTSGGCG